MDQNAGFLALNAGSSSLKVALFPATVELALCAILLAALIGVPAGVLAAIMGVGGGFILVPALL